MDETEEEKGDFLEVRKSFEKDPRKVIEIEMDKDGRFSERTRYAMENTLNLSLLSPLRDRSWQVRRRLCSCCQSAELFWKQQKLIS